MNKFKIDFFELLFLAEVCVPPKPIARAVFWDNLINNHYEEMNDNERSHFFDLMKPKLNLDNENCQIFYARFNPQNQYQVSCFHQGKAQILQAFRRNEKYWTAKTIWIDPQYIKEVQPLFKKESEK